MSNDLYSPQMAIEIGNWPKEVNCAFLIFQHALDSAMFASKVPSGKQLVLQAQKFAIIELYKQGETILPICKQLKLPDDTVDKTIRQYKVTLNE